MIRQSIQDHWFLDSMSDYGVFTLQYKDVARIIEKMHILFEEAGIAYGDVLHLVVRHGEELVLECDLPLCRTFGEVAKGELLAYTNELMNVSFTMNQASIVERYGIGFGGDWHVTFTG